MPDGAPKHAQKDLLAFADPPRASRTPPARTPSVQTPAPVNNTTPLSIRKPAPAAAVPARERVSPPAPAAKFPPVDAPDPDAAWDEFFASNKLPAHYISGHMLKLNGAGHHKQVIAALKAALINGQAQPWMYQALAGSMALENYPQDEIERVLLSTTDFGQANFESMMLSAAFLVRFNRLDMALNMYRQASRLQPESPEPYVLSLQHVAALDNADDVMWAACGVLRYDWTQERAQNTQDALAGIATLERDLAKSGNQAAVDSLKKAASEAQSLDVHVEVVWNGQGDVDLEVEEPSGSACTLTQPQTSGGGYHLGDGYGPRPEDCRETYVCPSGFAGEYRIRLKLAYGTVIGRRATVTITTHKGTPRETRETKTIVFDEGQGNAVVRLDQGRRQQPRLVEESRPVRQPVAQRPAAKANRRDPNIVQASGQGGPGGAVVGAIGFQPNIQVINEGARLGASAIISPDRRYVRMAISPVFSNITDVFTFSVFAGSPTAFGSNGGLQQTNP